MQRERESEEKENGTKRGGLRERQRGEKGGGEEKEKEEGGGKVNERQAEGKKRRAREPWKRGEGRAGGGWACDGLTWGGRGDYWWGADPAREGGHQLSRRKHLSLRSLKTLPVHF